MSDLPAAASSGAFNYFFIPSALLLGLLHGLEPGHSKTMMAAFIVAIRGTIAQAVLLALFATISHTAVVWVIALGGLAYGQTWLTASSEPYFELTSAILVIGVALWMFMTRLRRRKHHAHHDHVHENAHQAAHSHDLAHKFDGHSVTTGQVILFGLTGGLIPCPAAITVLLLCLQTDRLWLGAVLVLAFSLGLAVTLAISGIAAAIGLRHMRKRSPRFEALMDRAPLAASLITLTLGLYLGFKALSAI